MVSPCVFLLPRLWLRFLAFAVLLAAAALPALACEGRLHQGPGLLAAPRCLPATAERIAVLDATFTLGMALELGLPVVAAPLSRMSDTALQERALAAGVADIGSMLEPSLEALVAARPDMILGSALWGENHLPVLEQIAPTALITATDWRDYYRIVATLGDAGARLDAAFAALDARIAQVRARVPPVVVSVVRITSWDFQVYLDQPGNYAPFAILRELGVRRSAYETTPDPFGMRRPDWEEIAVLDGEILLYIIGGLNPSASDGRWEEVSADPLWQMLPAVQAGRVYRLDPAIWMEFSGITSAHRVIDDVERLLIGSP